MVKNLFKKKGLWILVLIALIIFGLFNLFKEKETPIKNFGVVNSKEIPIKVEANINENKQIIIKPQETAIKKIVFVNLNTSKEIKLKIDDAPKEKIETFIKVKNKEFVKVYAIDPTELEFDNANVTVVATGTSLYKCKEWNFTRQECYGEWSLFKKDLIPGREYTFILTQDDPGFGEINITKAEHLDENKTFIKDIYNETKDKNNIWSEPIYHNEWVRVTYEQNLTNENDITIYVRNNQSLNTSVEVYYFNSSEKLADFPIINETKYYKIFLTNITGSNDTFDLKIVNKDNDGDAYLEFDHITDPKVSTDPGSTSSLDNSGLDSIVRMSNGRLVMTYVDNLDDLWTAFSDDEGETWSNTEQSTGNYTQASLTINEDNFMILLVINNGTDRDVEFMNSTDGENWNGLKGLPNFNGVPGDDYAVPSIAVDDNGNFHACIIADVLAGDDANDSIHYINFTFSNSTWGPKTLVWANVLDDADNCDIEVNSSGTIFIAATGSDEQDVDIFDTFRGFSAGKIQVSKHDVTLEALDLEIDHTNESRMYIAYTEYGAADDLWLANSTDAGKTWSSKELDNSSADNDADLAIDGAGNIHIVYINVSAGSGIIPSLDGNDGSGPVAYINSTDFGNTFSSETLIDPTKNLTNPHIRFQNIVSSDRMNGFLDVVYANITGVFFQRKTVIGEQAIILSGCDKISAAGLYNLSQNVNALGTCFNITASNVELNCQGFRITYGIASSGMGINVSSSTKLNNITIKNCNILKNSTIGANNWGVQFANVANSTIFNNSILTNGTSNNYGINLQSGSNFNNVSGNTISTKGTTTANYGIQLTGSSKNNIISNNTIFTNGTSSNIGINIVSSSNFNNVSKNIIFTNGSAGNNYGIYTTGSTTNITSNTVSTLGSTTNVGIYLDTGSSNSTVSNNSVSTSGTTNNYGLLMNAASHSTITNNNISTNGTTGNNGMLIQSGSFNNTIIANTIVTKGTGTSRGMYISGASVNNTVSNNTISTSGGGNSDAFVLDSILANPDNTNFTNNTLLSIDGNDFNLDAAVNGTKLIDQQIRNYSIIGIGGTLIVRNTTFGEISFFQQVNGSGTSLNFNSTADIQIGNNSIFVNDSRNPGLNKSANISIFGTPGQPFTNPVILRNGIQCTSTTTPSCSNFTALTAATVIFNVTAFSNYSIGGDLNITSCGNIETSGNHILSNSVNAPGTCFNITTSNVELNCAGFRIIYGQSSSGIGINVSGTSLLSNITIRNCEIIKAGNADANNYGIFFGRTINSSVFNNSIRTNGSSENIGILLETGSGNLTVSNNTILTNGTTNNMGIQSKGTGIIIFNNSITTNGTSTGNNGIQLAGGSLLSNVTDNSINNFGTLGDYGVDVQTEFNNISRNVINNKGSGAGNVGIRVQGNNVTVFNNTVFTNATRNNFGIEISGSVTNVTVINNNISTAGSEGGNAGILIDTGSFNNVSNNLVSTSGTSNNDGVSIRFNSDNNTILHNIILSTRGVPSPALRLEVSGANYPENNTFINNTLINIAGEDLNLSKTGINGTHLIDQNIRNYSIAGIGSLVIIRNSTFGEISFFQQVNGSGINLVGNSSSDIQFSNNSIIVISNSSGNIGLNRSANITIFGTPGQRFINHKILRNGIQCTSTTTPSCSNFTSLTAATVIFNVTAFSNYSIGGDLNITCGNLNTAGITTLTQNVNAPGTCFNITASNIELNCAGFQINYSHKSLGFAINVSNVNNVTIKNCNILQGAIISSSNAINFANITNGSLLNTTIETFGLRANGFTAETNSTGILIN
ncbi:right-handed parallel beta-helix repeat-containing protein, partial [Candidatus Woesearchaeota archaeon]|nr:right-handed parallel beta-helix repeat-containing protein [Candidatus Woesearchaeota archaeon]